MLYTYLRTVSCPSLPPECLCSSGALAVCLFSYSSTNNRTWHRPNPWKHCLCLLFDWINSCSTLLFVAVVQLLSCVWLFETPWTAARQASLSFTISQSLFKLKCIEVVMPSNHLILCRPLLLLPLMVPSIRVFSKESALCIRWPKYYTRLFEAQRSKVTRLWSLG